MKKLFVTAMIILAIFSFSGCSQTAKSIERVERITGYDLPDTVEEVYHFKDDTFVGCAGQFSVYSLDAEPACFAEAKPSASIDDSVIKDMLDYLETYDIPEEYYPDFDREYTYITGAERTFILYFPEEKQLKIWMYGH